MGGRAFSGALWLSAARWSLRLGNTLGIILLARALGPDEFGDVAGALVVIGLFNVVGTLGMQAAVVQRKDIQDAHRFNVAWTYDTVLMKLVSAAVLFLCAPLVADLFDTPSLVAIVRVLACVPLIEVLENAAMLGLTKELDYRRRFLLETSKSVATVLTLVPLAFLLRDVWALVFATLAGSAGRALTSYLVYPHVPRLRLDPAVFKELFPFSRWIFGQNAFMVARAQLDKFLLGGLLGAVQMGIYQVGGRVSQLFLVDLEQTAGKVLFPIYARLHGDGDRVRRAFLLVLEVTAFVVVPTSALLAVLAPQVIQVLFGDDWSAAVPVMRVLLAAGALRTLVATAYPLFRGQGRPKYEFTLLILATLLQVPLTVAFTLRTGPVGTAVAFLASEALLTPLWAWLLRRSAGVSLLEVLRRLLVPTAAALAGATVTFLALLWAGPTSQLASLGLGLAAGGFASAAVLLAGGRLLGAESLAVVRRELRARWARPAARGPK